MPSVDKEFSVALWKVMKMPHIGWVMSQPGKGKNKKCKRKWLENMRTCRWSFIAIFKPWGGGGGSIHLEPWSKNRARWLISVFIILLHSKFWALSLLNSLSFFIRPFLLLSISPFPLSCKILIISNTLSIWDTRVQMISTEMNLQAIKILCQAYSPQKLQHHLKCDQGLRGFRSIFWSSLLLLTNILFWL